MLKAVTILVENGSGVSSINGITGIVSITSTGGTIAITEVGNSVNLETVGSGSGIIRNTPNILSDNTIGGAAVSTDYVYTWEGSSAFTYTQPTAVGNSNRYTLKNGSTINQTVNFSSGQNADGSTTLILTPNTSLDLISDTVNWRII